MKIEDFEKRYIHKTKIDIGDDCYIVLREPTKSELDGFGDNPEKNIEIVKKCFPSCIVEHSFDGASAKEVVQSIEKSASLYYKIITDWINDIPFRREKNTN